MTERELDEILTLRWPRILRQVMAESEDTWLRGFVRSIAKHGKRAGWRPSARQEQIMRRLLTEMSGPAQHEMELFES